ncbi:oligosaccharide flippase family protein [Qingshengfaniella alkalisoli]|uniref:oligosaccharide flippase family protein n=1 Tax=Qingshengfaniella alkalisoli TaxID=2599296 RepID=UPI00143D8CB2|nr:oligosaccharide flippase family protein [Qingshengfaniella alkalisoli]
MNPVKTALTFISGSWCNFVLRFVRNVLVARLLSVADFGIASTLMVAISLLQLFTNFNFGKLLVQHEAGDDPEFLAAIKMLNLLRSLLIAALLFLAAGPIATLMGLSEYSWAYRCMALVPLIQGLTHPEPVQLQRKMNFGLQLKIQMASLVLSLATLWPLYLWLGDFRVMIGVYVVETLAYVVISHMVATTPYRVRWNPEIARLGFRFGWPLFFAGIITFVVLQGDRLIVANFYGAYELGLLSASLSLTMVPMQQLGRMAGTFFLPSLSKLQNSPASFDKHANFLLQMGLCCSAIAMLGFCLLGPAVLTLVFGEKFAEAGPYVALLGIAFSLQFVRETTVTIAMSRANTINMLLSNIVRVLFVPVAIALAMSGYGIVEVLIVGAIGQMASVAASVALLYRRSGLGQIGEMSAPYLCAIVAIICLLVATWQEPKGYVGVSVASTIAVFATLALLACSRNFWGNLKSSLKRRGAGS